MKFGEIRFINNMKHIGKIIIIAAVALTVSLGLWMYLNGFLTKSKASNGIAHLKFTETNVQALAGALIHADLTVSATSGMSGVDISFTTTGSNLIFSYTDTVAHLPTGYELLLDEPRMTSIRDRSIILLNRMTLISKRPASSLLSSALIPLYFTVGSTGLAATSTLTVNLSTSQVVGVSETNVSGTVFSLEGEKNPLIFTLSVADPRAASVTNLECDIARNTSKANCGKGVAFTWTKSANADGGYKVYKNNTLIKTIIGKEVVSHNDQSCANFSPNTYKVIAYNTAGSISTDLPTVSCACQICPTEAPPTPTPIRPNNSADLIFRAIFPNAAANVNIIPDVRITILDNAGNHVCGDDTDCARVVTFERVPNTRVANTFRSPQLQYLLKKNQAYSVIVVQNHTLRQTYKNVYLRWMDVMQCMEGTNDSGCGDLIEEVVARPLFSGDLDKNNIIDQADKTKLNEAIGSQSAEGDLNFDSITDQKDVEILGKNFNKKGT